MSRPRYWWYGNVKKAIMMYPVVKNRPQSGYRRLSEAVQSAFKEIEGLDNPEMRKKAITMLLINKTHTLDGVSLELSYSPRVVNRWISQFVNRVGAYMGYDGEVEK